MKIQTILELIDPSVKTRYSPDRQVYISSNPKKDLRDPNHLGSGNFSKVMKSDDPHMVKKSSTVATAAGELNDGYWDYVDLIIANKLWENPHFPRIYKKENIRGSNDTSHHNVIMENLEPLNKKDDEEIVPVVRKSLNKRGKEEINNLKKSNPKKSLIQVFAHVLEQTMKSGNMSLIGDEQLMNALEILNTFRKENKVVLDMNEDNIMGRRTPVGLQLVITDPFAFKIPKKH